MSDRRHNLIGFGVAAACLAISSLVIQFLGLEHSWAVALIIVATIAGGLLLFGRLVLTGQKRHGGSEPTVVEARGYKEGRSSCRTSGTRSERAATVVGALLSISAGAILLVHPVRVGDRMRGGGEHTVVSIVLLYLVLALMVMLYWFRVLSMVLEWMRGKGEDTDSTDDSDRRASGNGTS